MKGARANLITQNYVSSDATTSTVSDITYLRFACVCVCACERVWGKGALGNLARAEVSKDRDNVGASYSLKSMSGRRALRICLQAAPREQRESFCPSNIIPY